MAELMYLTALDWTSVSNEVASDGHGERCSDDVGL